MADEAKPKSKESKVKTLVEPVFGPMVNLLTNQRIEGITEVPEVVSWLQAHLDAGKLTRV